MQASNQNEIMNQMAAIMKAAQEKLNKELVDNKLHAKIVQENVLNAASQPQPDEQPQQSPDDILASIFQPQPAPAPQPKPKPKPKPVAPAAAAIPAPQPAKPAIDRTAERERLMREYEEYLKKKEAEEDAAAAASGQEETPTYEITEYSFFPDGKLKSFAIYTPLGEPAEEVLEIFREYGSFNRNLKGNKGWIFSHKRLDAVKKAMSIN